MKLRPVPRAGSNALARKNSGRATPTTLTAAAPTPTNTPTTTDRTPLKVGDPRRQPGTIWHVVRIRPLRALAVLLLTATACGRSATSAVDKVAATRAAQAERVARDAGLPADVQRFLGRAAAGVSRSFTVAYRGADGVTTTLTQRPPDRRVDVVDNGSTESLLRLGTGTFACRRDGTSPWTCTKQAATAGPDPDLGVFSAARISDTVAALTAAHGAYTFKVVSRRVAGADASCLVTQPTKGGQADELCIAASGALLRVHSAQRTLDAVRYEDKADENALKLPAPAH